MKLSLYLSIGAIVLGYISTLAVSASHLAYWYRTHGGDLHPLLPWALAVNLEALAFLFSMLSNSIARTSPWTHVGALSTLALVWTANFFANWDQVPEKPVWRIFLSSAFVPIGTYVAGKTLGFLLGRLEVMGRGGERVYPKEPPEPKPSLPTPPAFRGEEVARLLDLLATPQPLSALYRTFPEHRSVLPDLLQRLEEMGLVARKDGYWLRTSR